MITQKKLIFYIGFLVLLVACTKDSKEYTDNSNLTETRPLQSELVVLTTPIPTSTNLPQPVQLAVATFTSQPIVEIVPTSTPTNLLTALPVVISLIAISDNWAVQWNDTFSFVGPYDLRNVPVQGIDSFVGEFESQEFYIDFDYGWYSPNPFAEGMSPTNESTFQAEEVIINGKQAQLGFYANNDHLEGYPFVYVAYFPDVYATGEENPTRLYFQISYKDSESKEAARLILTSIQFNG